MKYLKILFALTLLQTSCKCQTESSNNEITCNVRSIEITDVYINDPCKVAFNFLFYWNEGEIESMLQWSEETWFFRNLFEDLDYSILDSLSLDEKKDLAMSLSGVTKSFNDEKRSYSQIEDDGTNKRDNQPPSLEEKEIKLRLEGDIGYAIYVDKVVFLQKNINGEWKGFKVKKLDSSRKIDFIRNQ